MALLFGPHISTALPSPPRGPSVLHQLNLDGVAGVFFSHPFEKSCACQNVVIFPKEEYRFLAFCNNLKSPPRNLKFEFWQWSLQDVHLPTCLWVFFFDIESLDSWLNHWMLTILVVQWKIPFLHPWGKNSTQAREPSPPKNRWLWAYLGWSPCPVTVTTRIILFFSRGSP